MWLVILEPAIRVNWGRVVDCVCMVGNRGFFFDKVVSVEVDGSEWE